MKVKSESEVAQSCPTLSDPMDYRLPGSSIHGIFQAGVLEWGAIALCTHLSFQNVFQMPMAWMLMAWALVIEGRDSEPVKLLMKLIIKKLLMS